MATGVGLRIRERRKELMLSQEALAKRMGLKSKSTICKIERGEDNLTTDTIDKYAKALNTSPAFLMGWVSDPSPDYVDTIEGSTEQLSSQYKLVQDNLKNQVSEILKDSGIDPEILSNVDINASLGIERKSNSGKTYYFDDEAAEMAQELFTNKDQRILMSASKGLKPEAMKALTEIAKQMKMTNPEG